VDAKVLSGIDGALAALVMLAFSRTLNAEQITVLKNVNVIDGTGAPGNSAETVGSNQLLRRRESRGVIV